MKGYSNIPDKMGEPREWRGAERKQLENVLTLARKSRQWDHSLMDVTCWMGLLCLLAIAGGTAWLAYRLFDAGYDWLALVCVLDVAVLLVPHWITGVRRILTNDPLVVKIEELLRVMKLWESAPHDGEVMLPQMEVRTTDKGEMPCDAKLVLRLEALGDSFLGLQTQVVLNNVQGRDYPYLYCVLVARPALRILNPTAMGTPPKGIVVEPKHQEADDVDIMVIRQQTTKTKGYHTPPDACAAIFTFALGEARKIRPDTAASSPPIATPAR